MSNTFETLTDEANSVRGVLISFSNSVVRLSSGPYIILSRAPRTVSNGVFTYLRSLNRVDGLREAFREGAF